MSLPDLGVDWIKAKIDTGARTSSLHAFDIQEFERDDEPWVRFRVKPWQDSQEDAVVVESPSTTGGPSGAPPATRRNVSSCS